MADRNALMARRPFPQHGFTEPNGEAIDEPVGFENEWLDNVVRLYENGMLHPKVMEMLRPQIEAMAGSQQRRGMEIYADADSDRAISPYQPTPPEAFGGMVGGMPRPRR